jgi:serine/threonine protein kinase/tetratricopeptide (TPR) repeat protein
LAESLVGRTLGPYRIHALLGAGGMGQVYLAVDSRLDRRVALKVLPPDVAADMDRLARFRREAKAASALSHPNVATLYDLGEVDGVHFLTMEFVEGETLAARIRSRPQRTAEILAIGVQVADALDAAHARGITHRDIKPANLMLTKRGEVKVLDFGLAKFEQKMPASSSASTQSAGTLQGQVLGTLAYMSPEQVLGRDVDARSDLFSLGVVLYELVTSRLPFDGVTTGDQMDRIVHAAPDPMPHAMDATTSELYRIIGKCLEKDRERRYQSARELCVDLKNLQRDRGSEVQATSHVGTQASGSRVGAIPRPRARRRWAVAAVALTLIATASGVWWWRTHRTLGPRMSNVAEANRYYLLAENRLTAQTPARMREFAQQALALDPEFAAARVIYAFGLVLEVDGGYSNDRNLLYQAERELQHALKDDPQSARAHAVLAFVYYYQSRKQQVREEAEHALAIDPNDVSARMQMVFYHQLNGDYPQAQAILQTMLDADPNFPPARSNFGDNLRQMGDYAGAIREQLKVQEADPQGQNFVPQLALAYMCAGMRDDSRRLLDELFQSQTKNYYFRMVRALQFALDGRREDALREMDTDLRTYAELTYYSVYAAEFYALLGDTSESLNWLDRAIRAGDERVEWFERDPMLKNIQQEPRFKQMLDPIRERRAQRAKVSSGR